jgi:cellulose synthase/poly-beta-1,6-N-acetylglucosamine synthase-like glycosyltransferase
MTTGSRVGRLTRHAVGAAAVQLAVIHAYLLGLLWAAQRHDRSAHDNFEPNPDTPTRFVVLIPAHNEAHGISATVESLLSTDYLADCRRVVVIADNCTDDTASAALDSGAEVWVRVDPLKRAKGFALMWGLERLHVDSGAFDAVAIVDGDCIASSNLLSAMDRRVRAGSRALQCDYVVSNPDSGDAAAIRFAGFSLANTVRPRGKQQLGLSCGLLGTGMVFTSGLLAKVPWSDSGLAEDGEYHMRLVAAGERVEFVSEAAVSSAMPTTFATSAQQQARWERGKLDLLTRSPGLVAEGLIGGDPVRLHAGLEVLLPPQSLLAVCNLACLTSGLLLRSKRLAFLSWTSVMAQGLFVVLGLRLVGAPPQVYRAFRAVPILATRKLLLYAKILTGGGPRIWVRTARDDNVSRGLS